MNSPEKPWCLCWLAVDNVLGIFPKLSPQDFKPWLGRGVRASHLRGASPFTAFSLPPKKEHKTDMNLWGNITSTTKRAMSSFCCLIPRTQTQVYLISQQSKLSRWYFSCAGTAHSTGGGVHLLWHSNLWPDWKGCQGQSQFHNKLTNIYFEGIEIQH